MAKKYARILPSESIFLNGEPVSVLLGLLKGIHAAEYIHGTDQCRNTANFLF